LPDEKAPLMHCKYLGFDEKSMTGIKFPGLLDPLFREIFPVNKKQNAFVEKISTGIFCMGERIYIPGFSL
jgi:hypothetical protein